MRMLALFSNNISNTACLTVPTLSPGFVETIVSMTCMLSWDIAYHSMYMRYVQLIQIRLSTKLNELHDAMLKSSLVLRLKKKVWEEPGDKAAKVRCDKNHRNHENWLSST